MTIQTRLLRGLAFLLIVASGVACMPIQPVVRDGAGELLPLRNEAVSVIQEVTGGDTIFNPVDATPDPNGEQIYFTATTADGSGVFAVAGVGGEVQTLSVGAPFVTPQGIAISGDGATLYVADPGAEAVWMLPGAGGTPTALAGSEGLACVSVEVQPQADGDQLYCAGAGGGEPGLWRLPAGGGEAEAIMLGAPFVQPMGIAITSAGVLYIVDQAAGGNGLGSVFRIQDGQANLIVTNFRAGDFAGAALTADDAILLVSALDVEYDHAEVLLVDLKTLAKAVVTKVISANESSGGIHRAHNANVFAWADFGRGRCRAGTTCRSEDIQQPGHVYYIKP